MQQFAGSGVFSPKQRDGCIPEGTGAIQTQAVGFFRGFGGF